MYRTGLNFTAQITEDERQRFEELIGRGISLRTRLSMPKESKEAA